MSDLARRAIERTAVATSDVQDAARLLAERMRAGELEPRQVRLAAYAGNAAAVLASEGRVLDPREPLVDPTTPWGEAVMRCALRQRMPAFDDALWFRGLCRWGLAVVAWAGVATIVERRKRQESDESALMTALAAWLSAPSPECARAVAREAEQVEGSLALAAELVEMVANARALGRQELRRDVLREVETMLWMEDEDDEEDDVTSADLARVSRELAAWAIAPGRAVADDRPLELPAGATLRQRVMEAETSAARLSAIDVLVRHEGTHVTVVPTSGAPYGFLSQGTGIEEHWGHYGGTSRYAACPLDLVVEVRPGEEP